MTPSSFEDQEPPRNPGRFKIDGLPPAVLREFSRRRRAIETHLAATGRAGVGAAQVACLQTRPGKSGRTVTALLANWWRRAQAHLGDPAAAVQRVLHRERPLPLSRVHLESCAQVLFGPDGVTAKQSSFDRGDLTRVFLEVLPTGTSLTQTGLDRTVDGLLGDPRVLPLVDAATRRYTTRELAGTELAALRLAAAPSTVPTGTVPPARVDALSAEQRTVVQGIAASVASVDVVLGPAGAGKTALLAALHGHYRDAGVPVVGACVAAIAARRLENATAIPATSIARLTHQLHRGERLPAGCVLVVDEAGMVGTRDYHQLLYAVTGAGGKMVAVGDRAQLTEIDAGGMFARLSRLQLRGELTDNHRQTHQWERDALVSLRRGDLLPALRAYARHDRLHHHPDATTLRDAIADRYVAALDDSNPLQVVALSGSRTGATALNTAIRERLRAARRLGDDQPVGDHALAVGEVVLITRNDHPRALLNGTRGIVTAINRRGVRLRLDDQRDVTVPTSWAAERLRSAYAMTVHKAQGLTVDVALVDTTSPGDRNSAYVAASRARHRTELHHTDTDQLIDTLAADPFTPRPLSPAEAHAQVVSRLRRHREQRLATSQAPQWSPTTTTRRPSDPYERDQYHRGPDRGYGISR